jgi:hypothetical protein
MFLFLGIRGAEGVFTMAARMHPGDEKATDLLLQGLKRKIIGSPEGLEPPNLAVMISGVADAIEKDRVGITVFWLDILRHDLAEAKKCIAGIEAALPYIERKLQKRSRK